MRIRMKWEGERDGNCCRVPAAICRAVLGALLAAVTCPWIANCELPHLQIAASAAPASPGTAQPGVPYSAQQLGSLLPPSVYFQGQTANLQLRNAGAVEFSSGAITWVCLVDSSGYASDVAERYQFYLVTESRLHIGDAELPAGAYGGGFLKNGFVIMDLGGHTIASGAVQTDASLQHPRPLQMQTESPMSVKLFLGRRWVLLQADPAAAPSR